MAKLSIQFNLAKGDILRGLGLSVMVYGASMSFTDYLAHPERQEILSTCVSEGATCTNAEYKTALARRDTIGDGVTVAAGGSMVYLLGAFRRERQLEDDVRTLRAAAPKV